MIRIIIISQGELTVTQTIKKTKNKKQTHWEKDVDLCRIFYSLPFIHFNSLAQADYLRLGCMMISYQYYDFIFSKKHFWIAKSLWTHDLHTNMWAFLKLLQIVAKKHTIVWNVYVCYHYDDPSLDPKHVPAGQCHCVQSTIHEDMVCPVGSERT